MIESRRLDRAAAPPGPVTGITDRLDQRDPDAATTRLGFRGARDVDPGER